MMRALAAGLVRSCHSVDVVTTSLTTVRGPRSQRTQTREHEGSTIRYAATPISYRWMGITPTLPALLERMPRPDVVHIFGFRDPVGTTVAAWCRVRGIPYVFEALGMFQPKLRKVGLKRGLDATLFRHVTAGATTVVAASQRERHEYVTGGIADTKVAVRPNGFPLVSTGQASTTGSLRAQIGAGPGTPVVLSVGRVAAGKGLELLVDSIVSLPGVHLVIVGPDDGHGTSRELRARCAQRNITERVHLLGPVARQGIDSLYDEADVLALASRHENFGMVAAEAAARGSAVLVTDRCGIADLLGDQAALVVPYSPVAVRDGLARLVSDASLRARLGDAAAEVARQWSWERVVTLQEDIYLRALAA